MHNNLPIWPLHQFDQVTHRYLNNLSGRGFKVWEFHYNCLFAADFKGLDCSSGWIEMTFNLATTYKIPMTLVTWSIVKSKVEIDKYHHIERSLL